MKLYTHPGSPFGRKAVIAAIETGLDGQVELVTINPWESPPELVAANPLSKIPALVADDGTAILDSPAVCDFLDTLHGKHRLIPADPVPRARALRRQALGDGLLEAAFVILLNRAQKPERVHRGLVARQEAAIARTLGRLEAETDGMHDGFNLGHISLVCALDFLSVADVLEWQGAHPHLVDWLERLHDRPSVARTHPIPPGQG